MNLKMWHIFGILYMVCLYLLVFYLIFTHQIKLDFNTFYASALALKQGANPYTALVGDNLPIHHILSNNLCPPSFLWLFRPLSDLNYHQALVIWSFVSFLVSLVGASITFSLAYTPKSLRLYRFALLLIYLMLFPTIMNLAVGQLGAFLFFFTMLGYYYYVHQRDYLAGFFWGLIISIKLFPGLLFFFVLRERRVYVFYMMLLVCIGSWLIPLLIYGPQLYREYYDLISHISWYGDSWNAGVNGYIVRGLTDHYLVAETLRSKINLFYLIIFLAVLGLYCLLLYRSKITKKQPTDHYRFCITLAFMLLLSPLSWIYYFSLLIFPLALVWSKVNSNQKLSMALFLWLVSFFFLNFPLDYVRIVDMSNCLSRVTFYSIHFYGLLLLTCLIIKEGHLQAPQPLTVSPIVKAIIVVLIWGAIIPFASFLKAAFKVHLAS